jgi:hypothetical protein
MCVGETRYTLQFHQTCFLDENVGEEVADDVAIVNGSVRISVCKALRVSPALGSCSYPG